MHSKAEGIFELFLKQDNLPTDKNLVANPKFIGTGKAVSEALILESVTVVCKIVHKLASVWCKTAQGEVGVSLP